MTKPVIAPGFCQVAWVVKDIAAAEKFFVETMGCGRFMHMENLAAKDTEGTYLGKPGNWVAQSAIIVIRQRAIELRLLRGDKRFLRTRGRRKVGWSAHRA